jgi:hypothetical protein
MSRRLAYSDSMKGVHASDGARLASWVSKKVYAIQNIRYSKSLASYDDIHSSILYSL